MRLITANELASYVVCPEAWRLKLTEESTPKGFQAKLEAGKSRRKWAEEQELSHTLRYYAKVVYALLSGIVGLVFVLEHYRSNFLKNLHYKIDIHVPDEILFLLIFLGLLIFMWDFFQRRSKKIKTEGGLSETSQMQAIKGSEKTPLKYYRSTELGLSAQPDALISENKQLIPVIIKPTTNKIRDRHVVELLTCLRLIEEEQGQPSAYGILIMGKEKRQVKIAYTEEKRRWHQTLIEEMRSILEDGVPAVPAPAAYKCGRCDVEKICQHSALKH